MVPFSPKNTLAVLILVGLYIFGMYVMSDVMGIPSYREDHHILADEHNSGESEAAHQAAEHPSSSEHPSGNNRHGESEHPTEKVDTEVSHAEQPLEEKSEVEKEPSPVSDEDYFRELVGTYNKEVTSVIPETENRTDVVIRYYDHASDQGRAEILKKYRYYIHLRETADNLDKYESNSLFYGDSVSTRDIQMVAYLLISNGIPIRQIVKSKFHDGWKARAIEIGTDLDMASQPVMPLSEVRAFKNDFYESYLGN